jgi:hypothetical protein
MAGRDFFSPRLWKLSRLRSCCQRAKSCHCRPIRPSFRPSLEVVEARVGPTNLLPDVLAAGSLASMIRPPEPLLALVQHTPASDFFLPSPLRGGAGGEVNNTCPPSQNDCRFCWING